MENGHRVNWKKWLKAAGWALLIIFLSGSLSVITTFSFATLWRDVPWQNLPNNTHYLT